MKVYDLIEILNNLDPEFKGAEVVLQKDAEGNGFSKLFQVYTCGYIEEGAWGPRVVQQDRVEGSEAVNAILLEPT